MSEAFDYVIVGAVPRCVLANRLSADAAPRLH